MNDGRMEGRMNEAPSLRATYRNIPTRSLQQRERTTNERGMDEWVMEGGTQRSAIESLCCRSLRIKPALNTSDSSFCDFSVCMSVQISAGPTCTTLNDFSMVKGYSFHSTGECHHDLTGEGYRVSSVHTFHGVLSEPVVHVRHHAVLASASPQ